MQDENPYVCNISDISIILAFGMLLQFVNIQFDLPTHQEAQEENAVNMYPNLQEYFTFSTRFIPQG